VSEVPQEDLPGDAIPANWLGGRGKSGRCASAVVIARDPYVIDGHFSAPGK
jgi:hypothetical protein